jgi:hypothetical protein
MLLGWDSVPWETLPPCSLAAASALVPPWNSRSRSTTSPVLREEQRAGSFESSGRCHPSESLEASQPGENQDCRDPFDPKSPRGIVSEDRSRSDCRDGRLLLDWGYHEPPALQHQPRYFTHELLNSAINSFCFMGLRNECFSRTPNFFPEIFALHGQLSDYRKRFGYQLPAAETNLALKDPIRYQTNLDRYREKRFRAR